jgi:hypothetical protein
MRIDLVLRSRSAKTIRLRPLASLMRERNPHGLLERLAGVRYLSESHPLAGHPAINSGQNLQPEVLRIRFHAGTFP